MSTRKEVGKEDLCHLLGTRSERKERLLQVSCYSTGNETGGWTWRQGEVWICSQTTCFYCRSDLWAGKECLLDLGAGLEH